MEGLLRIKLREQILGNEENQNHNEALYLQAAHCDAEDQRVDLSEPEKSVEQLNLIARVSRETSGYFAGGWVRLLLLAHF